MACENVAVEFSANKLTFAYSKPEDFVTSSWNWCGSKLYMSFRLLTMLLLFAYCTFDIVWNSLTEYQTMPAYWLLYGINWIFLLLVATYFFQAVITTKYICCGRLPSGCSYQSFWVFHTISTNAVWMMSLIYWMGLHEVQQSNFSSISEKCKHVILAVFVLLDLIISAVPIRLIHAIYSISCGLIYALFNMVYTMADGPLPPGGSTSIYPGMDWTSAAGSGLMGMLVFFIGILTQTLIYAVFVFRCFLRELINGTASGEDRGVPGVETRENAPAAGLLSRTSSDLGGSGKSPPGNDRELENVVQSRPPPNYSTITK